MIPQIFLCLGEQHSLDCSTNWDYLQWEIQYSSSQTYYYNRFLSAYSRVGNYHWRRIGGTTINYTKNSEPGVLPLTSTLLIDPVTTSVDGIVITCYLYGDIIFSWTISMHVINGKKLMQAASQL